MTIRPGQAKGPSVGTAGGGGGGGFPLAPARVVTTDAAGLPTVGPYWDPATGFVSLFAAPTTSEFEVIRSKVGTVNITFRNTNAASNGNVAVTLLSDYALGRVYHQYANAYGVYYSIGLDNSLSFVLSDGAGLPATYLMEFSRWGSASHRQVSFLGAVAVAAKPFYVAVSRASTVYEYAFEMTGGGSGTLVVRTTAGNTVLTAEAITSGTATLNVTTAASTYSVVNPNSTSLYEQFTIGAGIFTLGMSGGATGNFGLYRSATIGTNPIFVYGQTNDVVSFFAAPSTDDFYIAKTRSTTPPMTLRVRNLSNANYTRSRVFIESNNARGYAHTQYVNATNSWYAGLGGIGQFSGTVIDTYVIGYSDITTYTNDYLRLSYISTEKQISLLEAVPTVLYQFCVATSASTLSADRHFLFSVGGGAGGLLELANSGVGDSTLIVSASFGSPMIRWTDSALEYTMGSSAGAYFGLFRTIGLGTNPIFQYDSVTFDLNFYSGASMDFSATNVAGNATFRFHNADVTAGSKTYLTIDGGDTTETHFQIAANFEIIAYATTVSILGPSSITIGAGDVVLDASDEIYLIAATHHILRTTGGVVVRCETAFTTTPPANPATNGHWSFFVLENGGVNTFEVRYKDSGGTVRSGSVALV